MSAPKRSVAIVIRDASGRYLAVRRSDTDDTLPGMWGLPAATLRDGETPEAAARRAARDKLGVDVAVGPAVGEAEAGGVHLTEYEATITRGAPSPVSGDVGVSRYADVRYTSDPGLLREAARRGSLCSRILLRASGVGWDA